MEYTITESGMLGETPEFMVDIRGSQNAIIETQVSPWPYSRKAVVISVPEGFTKYEPGDTILIAKHCVMTRKNSKEGQFHMIHGFTTSGYNGLESPQLKSDPHYGFLMIDPYLEILGLEQ